MFLTQPAIRKGNNFATWVCFADSVMTLFEGRNQIEEFVASDEFRDQSSSHHPAKLLNLSNRKRESKASHNLHIFTHKD